MKMILPFSSRLHWARSFTHFWRFQAQQSVVLLHLQSRRLFESKMLRPAFSSGRSSILYQCQIRAGFRPPPKSRIQIGPRALLVDRPNPSPPRVFPADVFSSLPTDPPGAWGIFSVFQFVSRYTQISRSCVKLCNPPRLEQFVRSPAQTKSCREFPVFYLFLFIF